MENLVINPTKTTFGINFNSEAGALDISGTSYPDNAIEFFKPILDWVKEFTEAKNNDTLIIQFKVNYYNTSSSKYLFKMLEMVEKFHSKGNNVEIIWHYYEGEEDMLDTWKELIEELDLPYKIEMD